MVGHFYTASRPRVVACLAAAAVCLSTGVARAVVSETTARQAGLTRAWFTQAAIDPATQQITGATLADGVIYLLSSAGKLQAIDAATGAPKWTRRFGDRIAPVAGPTVRGDRIAVVIGSTAYLIDTATGAESFSKRLDGAAGGSVAIGEEHVFAPMIGGRLMAHPIDYATALPFSVASPGTVLGRPVIGSERVIWSTAEGMVYAARTDGGGPSYRYDAAAPLSGSPIVDQDRLYFATITGFVYSLETERGRPVWRTAVEGSVAKPLAQVTETVYAAAETPALHALSRDTGKVLWSVEGVSDFAAASEGRVYAVAPGGALAVLDRKTGEPVASWPATQPLTPVANSETDRVYLLTDRGALQCFHEIGRDKPFLHSPPEEEPVDEQAQPPASDQPPADDEPAEPIPGFDDPPAESSDESAPLDLFEGDDNADEAADDGFANPFDF